MGDKNHQDIYLPVTVPAVVTSLKVEVGSRISSGTLVATYLLCDTPSPAQGQDELCLRSSYTGQVAAIFCKDGATIQPSEPVCSVDVRCDHSIVVFDMCANCGKDLRRKSSTSAEQYSPPDSEVRVIHGMPELRVSQKEAEALGKKDYLRLLSSRKLALIVDLDQTLVHTSMDPNIEPGLPDVYGFHLPDYHLLYHCRLRPFTREFLARVATLYELHVFTMGTKTYAASVTNILDPEHKFFSDRIISRDECFDPRSKALRLKSLFPCGDSLVAIIDDREDVWGRSPNLIHVKPYLFFSGTSDINFPPTSNHSRRHVGRLHHQHAPYQQHHRRRQSPGKGYSLSNPLPFKVRHVIRQPAAVPAAEGMVHETGGKHPTIPPTESGDCRETGAGSQAAEDLHVPSNQLPDSSGVVQESNDVNSIINMAENSMQSTGTDTGEAPSSTLGGETSGGGNGISSDGVRELEPSDNSCAESFRPGVRDEQEDLVVRSSDLRTPADMSMEEEEASSEIPEHLSSEQAGQPQEAPVSSSVWFSGNNINNNNNKDGDGTSKNGKGSDSDTSSDSSSSISSSSGIDDSLFDDMAARDAGDEGEGEAGVSSTGQNGEAAGSTGTDPSGSTKASDLSANMSEKDYKRTAPPPIEIKDPDTFLLQLADILERVHAIFYEQYDGMTLSRSRDCTIPDLKKIIPELRQSILKGCRILFTGIIPTNTPPRKNAEWRTARAFGATIHTELIPGLDSTSEDEALRATTHVIAGKPGTTKMHEASRLPGVKIISAKWLWTCAEHWKRVDEADFELDHPAGKKRRQDRVNDPPTSKRRSLPVESSQDDDGKMAEEAASSIENLRRSFDKSTAPDESAPVTADAEDSEDSSSSDDNIFKNSVALTSLAKMDTTQLKRHLSLESQLSVSDEELVRMDAEVEAEISESSSSSSSGGGDGGEELGTHLELPDHNDNLSYENFAGTDSSDDLDSVLLERRKRKFDELGGSSSSESDVPAVESFLNESVVSDEDLVKSGDEEEEDELSKLLGF